jgi:hypothetical protein
MARVSVDKSWGDKVQAKEKMKNWLEHDRRFDAYDKDRLVDRVMLCRYNGARLELDDPELMQGGSPRPLTRSRW